MNNKRKNNSMNILKLAGRVATITAIYSVLPGDVKKSINDIPIRAADAVKDTASDVISAANDGFMKFSEMKMDWHEKNEKN